MWQTDRIRKILDSAFPDFESDLKEFISYSGTLKSYHHGAPLVKKGSGLRTVMLVVKGNIKMLREGRDEKEYFVYVLGPGEACALSLIGLSAVAWKEMRPVALGETEVIHIAHNLVQEMMLRFPSWNSFLMRTSNTRMECMLQLLDSLTYRDLEERLTLYLEQMIRKLNTKQLEITHQEIANDLHASREGITRTLKRMEQKGIIKSDRYCLEWLGPYSHKKGKQL